MGKSLLLLKSVALRGERRLSAGMLQHRAPAWSRDGEFIAYAVGEEHQSAWLVTDRRGRVAAHFAGPAVGSASFSPSGGIAMGRRFAGQSEIWFSPRPGIGPVRLCGGDGSSYLDPCFSPDGEWLAHAVAESDRGYQIALLNMVSGERRLLTRDGTRSDRSPAFSPDGRTLFFCGQAATDDSVIYALALDQDRIERVSEEGRFCQHPAPLSRDWVVVEQSDSRTGRARLCFVDRQSGRQRTLGEGELEQRDPACLLDKGKLRLAYASLLRSVDNHPPRFDICVARFKGVELVEEAPPFDGPTTEPFEKLSLDDIEGEQAEA